MQVGVSSTVPAPSTIATCRMGMVASVATGSTGKKCMIANTSISEHDGKRIACRWNILGPVDTYFLSEDEAYRVQLTYGDSPHQMKKDMEVLLKGARPRAVQFFESSPAAINGRAYYPEF